jgi:poly(hydroxyalkanoate) granule-associated protein
MVKKLKKIAQEQQQASPAKLFEGALAGNIKDSAQQIWLAGMGAFSRAQAEGGKVFEALVTEGMKLQRKSQSVAEERITEVAGRMTAMADGVTAKAGAQWDKLESIFEERVSKALNKLGVPARGDIDALIERIDALAARMGDAPATRKGNAPAAHSTTARVAKATRASKVSSHAAIPAMPAPKVTRSKARKTAGKTAAPAASAPSRRARRGA